MSPEICKLRSVQNTGTWYPRPMRVCQEPGLRPIGRIPGVPDKPAKILGSMCRYPAQILICFNIIHFQFSFPLLVGLGLLNIRTATVPCHDSWFSEWDCSSDNKISQYALHGLSAAGWNYSLAFIEFVKLTNKMDAIHITGKFFSTGAMCMGRFLFIPVSILLYFSSESGLISEVLNKVVRLFRQMRQKDLAAVTQLSNLSWKVFYMI